MAFCLGPDLIFPALTDVTAEALEEAVAAFLGEIVQIPPMYSALKVNGKCLYQLKVIVFFTNPYILLDQFRCDAF